MGSVIYTFVLIQSYFVGVNHQRRKLNSRMGKGEGSGEGWGEGQGKGGEWKGSLCGSCDCGSKCLIGCCCPPCGNYFVAQKMNEEGWPAWIGFLDFCGGAGLWEIAVLQCAAFRVLHANIPITLELTNKYKKLFPICLKTIANQHIENFYNR